MNSASKVPLYEHKTNFLSTNTTQTSSPLAVFIPSGLPTSNFVSGGEYPLGTVARIQ